MKHSMEEGVSAVLSNVVEDVGQAVHRNVHGAQLLHELLNAPWLRALLKVYECLLQFQRLMPSPVLPSASRLSYEVIAAVQKSHRPSAEAAELCSLLIAPHMQALLASHDSVAQLDFGPVLPPLPDDMPEDEEAMRIVCLVKNNQPLNGGGRAAVCSRWSSLRRLTLERLVPARRARSGEELRATESEHRELNQSAPSVLSPAPCDGSFLDRHGGRRSSDDYAYPPPPVPAFTLSLPNSPVLYKKAVTGGQSRNVPTPGRTPPCCGRSPARAQTAPSSPPCRRHTLSARHRPPLANPQQQERRRPPLELSRQRSVDDHSTAQTAAGGAERGSRDVLHLGEKMMAVTEMMTDSVEENAQALSLLAEVVDKLQGLIVASKQLEAPAPPSPSPRRPKQPPPPPPPRVSSMSPKAVRKPPTPYPRRCSSSSSCSSRSSSSLSSGGDSFVKSNLSPKRTNGSRMMAAAAAAAASFGSGGRNGQGATIRRDEDTGDIYIARVIHGGLADRSGLLHPGDLLVEVNGSPVVGLEPEQVIQILINSQGTILFKVIPNVAQSSSSQKSVFMRAMVDYCPLQDACIPCPDAGMAFSRGDLLEVVDQSDGQWWQARKLPSTGSCAGLIPSASTLKSKQREQWWCQPLQVHTCIRPLSAADNEDDRAADDKRVIAELEELHFDEAECDGSDGIYLAGFRRSFRLWRRTSCRRRRQSCTSCSPSSAALATPYEEVALYQRPPQENHRLIILVGASGVGVSELRRRLIRLNPSTFQGPVPHTTRPMRGGEQTGREYHFVTKELFEYMVCNHRFVEYGEHRGHLYGTSTDAIDDVLRRGRMCIIDVEPHSILPLRTGKLKPFVIFIKTPSPERLRHTRRDARILTSYSLNRTFTEEDFEELEEVSRLMELKYRQFFDSVVVNDDLLDSCIQLCSIIQEAQEEAQWTPVSWSRTQE